jgi:hypothetical protein
MPDVLSTAPSSVDGALSPGTVVAGYRLLRQVAGIGATNPWLARGPGGEETLCLTVQPATEALGGRLALHSRISSSHVLRLVDLATDTDGHVVLVHERTDWTLATLLSCRVSLAPGEAVTVLAPLVAGLSAIHRAGLCLGGVSPATVLFCPDGRPVIGGLDVLSDAQKDSSDDEDHLPRGILADYRSLGALIDAVAYVVDEPARSALSDISVWIGKQLNDSSATGSLLAQLECRLFTVAPALPVVLAPDRGPLSAGVQGRSGPPARAGYSFAVPNGRPTDVWPALAEWAAAARNSGVGAWMRRVMRGRAFVVCLGIVLLVGVLLAGLAAIPDRAPGSAGSAAEAGHSPHPAGITGETESPAVPAPVVGGAPADHDPAGLEDPVAATIVLLELRMRCAREGSAACVSRYAEPASALAEADIHALGKDGSSRLLAADGAEVQLLQDYGDVALMRAATGNEERQPVLVLAVRTDTGWRLRDLFEPD